MAFIIASDIHSAKVWDHITEVMPKDQHILNPNTVFKKLIATIKEADTLIINGDLIDYQNAEYQKSKKKNWEYFFKILKGCKGKYFLNIGNHDYRHSPYNFSIYGLHHINISPNLRKQYKKKIGFCALRGLKEKDSILVKQKYHTAPPWYPNKRFYSTIHDGKELVFLDSGPDALNHIKNWFMPWRWPIMFSETSSRGLDKTQLSFLKQRIKKGKGDLWIFIHAPPFFTSKPFSKINISKDEHLRGYKFRKRTFFDKNKEFVDILLNAKRNVIVISGHVHVSRQFLIDKKKNQLRQSSLKETNEVRKNKRYIKFLTTLPVGAIRRPEWHVGYLRYEKGKFKNVVLDDFS